MQRKRQKGLPSNNDIKNIRKYVQIEIPAYFRDNIFRANGLWYRTRYFIMMKKWKVFSNYARANGTRTRFNLPPTFDFQNLHMSRQV